jgi:hypothetical protein
MRDINSPVNRRFVALPAPYVYTYTSHCRYNAEENQKRFMLYIELRKMLSSLLAGQSAMEKILTKRCCIYGITKMWTGPVQCKTVKINAVHT